MSRSRMRACLGATLAFLCVACGGPGSDTGRTPNDRPAGSGAASSSSSAVPATATVPANPCGWISVGEVAAIVGPLAGEPRRHEGGCLYPLPLDSETVRRRELAQRLEQRVREMGATPMEDHRPTEPAVILDVDLNARALEERAQAMANEVAAGWLDQTPKTAGPPRDRRGRSDGWDHASATAIGVPGFTGRLGQLRVTVEAQVVRVPKESMAKLAAAVRDRVPDRPFGGTPNVGSQASGPDPCSLLTAPEVQPVIGTLVVAPYRSREASATPDPGGPSCTYFSAGHHALVLTPEWQYGKSTLSVVRGIGGLISAVAPDGEVEAADTLEGPWDEVVMETGTGDLYFLKGIRSLQVSYGASSIDAAGVLRLVPTALERLAAAPRR